MSSSADRVVSSSADPADLTNGGHDAPTDGVDAPDATNSRLPNGLTVEAVASALRERIYGSIACLSTLLVITGYQELDRPWERFVDVLVAAGGLWGASVLAEFVAHIGAHQAMPRVKEVRHMFWVSSQIMAASAVPLVLLVLSGIGVLPVHTAVWAGVWVLVVEMGGFAFLAVRRTSIRPWAKVLLVGSIMLLGVLVVFLKTLAH